MIVYDNGEEIVICDNCGEEVFDGEYEESPDGKHYCTECLNILYAQEQ